MKAYLVMRLSGYDRFDGNISFKENPTIFQERGTNTIFIGNFVAYDYLLEYLVLGN